MGTPQVQTCLASLNLHIGHDKLPIAVRLQNAEEVSYNLFLPVNQLKRFAVPFAFGMFQKTDKGNGTVCRIFVVTGGSLEFVRFVVF